MVNVAEELLKTLQELREEEFKRFKWFLGTDDVLNGFPNIPVAQLENAESQDTVDLMVQNYQVSGAREVTMMVLQKIRRNDLVQRLKSSSSGPRGNVSRTHILLYLGLIVLPIAAGLLLSSSSTETTEEQETPAVEDQIKECSKEKAGLQCAQEFAVNVTLDPDTAHPNLILSEDRKRVHHSDVRQELPYSPKRFTSCIHVLGKQNFSSGRFYFEVEVRWKTGWTVGVASESTERDEEITLSPERGYWTMCLSNGTEYVANAGKPRDLSLKSQVHRVGVFVDYDAGLVSFFDADTADLLYTFSGSKFTENLYPLLSPDTNDGGKNSAPLIIRPVDPDD